MLYFKQLENDLEGTVYYGDTGFANSIRMIYATDASMYQEKPVAVAFPVSISDLRILIRFAVAYNHTLIPRTAGTSLAGQVVGNGIIVDVSLGWDKIVEINREEKWAIVQPGLIRDDLNKHLLKYGLMFGPETSTSNRAMIGGMVGNNSCGLRSIKWGDVRDNLLEANVLLSDGSEATFKALNGSELQAKASLDSLEGRIYKEVAEILKNSGNRKIIEKCFPKKSVKRKNTGYALNSLMDASPFNLCKLLAGSEGTLCFFTEFKIKLIDLPPAYKALLCIHFASIRECLDANIIVMSHAPYASELTDKKILDFTKHHPQYHANRFFIDGDPQAILMVEFYGNDLKEVKKVSDKLIADLKIRNYGYAYPVLLGADIDKAWEIRKAGLGLLRNTNEDAKPVNLIEDCAVSIEDLPDYVDDIKLLMDKRGLVASYYAHAGAGELHIEPLIDLKNEEGHAILRELLNDVVELVRKYKGSLSGEHGDGRLRGEFIPIVMGEEVYDLFKQIKRLFDPHNVFNSGKITDSPPMDKQLRYFENKPKEQLTTVFNFNKEGSILKLSEKCSGSGDCRKSHLSGGIMCPSFMATRQEKDSTRARANILRQFLTNANDLTPFNHEEIKDIMDLCLSCKGCKIECPSSVDVSKMKAEFLQQYYYSNGVPLRTRLVANYTAINKVFSIAPFIYNFILENKITSGWIKKTLGFAVERSLPKLNAQPVTSWFKQWKKQNPSVPTKKKVFLFMDEFTNFNDGELGKNAIRLLHGLGYDLCIPKHIESGRSYISKGLLNKAKRIAETNVELLWPQMQNGIPLIGLEPSAIFSFRDEYPDLVRPSLAEKAEFVAKNTYSVDEFIAAESDAKNIIPEQFTAEKKEIILHGHCHQKALSQVSASEKILSLPANFQVTLLPSGCCGMAGSFGYEKEHYEISMNIGNLILFPAVKAAGPNVIVAAPGTSCRHQIKDGTDNLALHPVDILWQALIKDV